MGATQHDGIDGARRGSHRPQRRRVAGAQGVYLLRIGAFNGGGQAVAGLQYKAYLRILRLQQGLEFVARQRAAGGQHAHCACAAARGGGFECGLYAHDGQRRVGGAQCGYCRCGGGVAGHHQRLDLVALHQIVAHSHRARQHMGHVAFAIGRVARV